MIRDLFSHKIHASSDDWPDKLVELACIFNEFDGKVYDRVELEERLAKISPRSSFAPRDVSKFRDEISAYPAYLGIYWLERSSSGWIIRLSDTARRFLVREEPDVGAFLRLQLSLFQYPNGMGAAYGSGSRSIRIQANVRDRSLEFIRDSLHLSPFRLVCACLKADSAIRQVDVFDSRVSYEEIYALANYPDVNRHICPPQNILETALKRVRRGQIAIPRRFERRFHLLQHTELIELIRGGLKLRSAEGSQDREEILAMIETIGSIETAFHGFDECEDQASLVSAIAGGSWGRYFDGVRILSRSQVASLSSDLIALIHEREPLPTLPNVPPSTYPFHQRAERAQPNTTPQRRQQLTDPEMTRIRRQRRNLIHKELVDKMDELLRKQGALPHETAHIDLYAEIPGDGSFLFEMKSGGDSLLEQIRKGVSQLYEYRYRYAHKIKPDTTLCLVTPRSASELGWLLDYLCNDRSICLCWFSDTGGVEWPDECGNRLSILRE